MRYFYTILDMRFIFTHYTSKNITDYNNFILVKLRTQNMAKLFISNTYKIIDKSIDHRL